MHGEAVAEDRGGKRSSAAVRRGERGAVVAEAALVIPVLVALTLGLVWLVGLAVAQVRVVDAGREAARVAARGGSVQEATQAARAVAPEGARVRVQVGEGRVTVDVRARVRGPGGLFRALPAATVSGRAVAAREPS